MALAPYTKTEPPSADKLPVITPRAISWTSRVWRHSRAGVVPLFKIDLALDIAAVEDRALQEALRPFEAQLQRFALYILHPEESKPLAPWAVGRLDVDEKSAYIFLHDFLAAPNGMLMLNLLQAQGAATEFILSLVPMTVERNRILFAIPDYDLGVRAPIG
ncbi:MAG TPA: hypothetical protein VFF87_06280 [Hyphomicrobium sp.]|nr:hypothetical protein [Hyphomicrobium sp.]